MYWIIQNNLWNELNFTNVVETLERMNIPHEIVKVIPFVDELADSNNEVDEKYVPPTDLPVYICGGTTLVKIAQKKGWIPGAFLNENFNAIKHNEVWGELMLNYNAIQSTFGDLSKPSWITDNSKDQFFIRPVNDDKSFAGHVTTWDAFKIWQKKVIKLRDTYTTLNANTELIVAPIKEIYKEYRFFIVDQKIATHSLYKLGNRVAPRNDFIDDDLRMFVNQCIWKWQPDRAFVIDIAETPDGFKIVEINCINSSGFYACDVVALIEAIEFMTFKEFPDHTEFQELSYSINQIILETRASEMTVAEVYEMFGLDFNKDCKDGRSST